MVKDARGLGLGYTAHLQFIRWNLQMIMQLPETSSESGSAPSMGFSGRHRSQTADYAARL